VQALAKSPLTKKYDLSSITEIGSGAAPLGGEVIEEAEALWPEGDRKLKVLPLKRQLILRLMLSSKDGE
jgi:4-coumarate--CoA ligase